MTEAERFLIGGLLRSKGLRNLLDIDVSVAFELTRDTQTRETAPLAQAQGRGDEEDHDDGDALDGKEVDPDVVGFLGNDGARTAERAAPRQHIHHGRRQSDDCDEDIARHTKRLVERQQRGNGKQERRRAGAVEVRHDGDGGRTHGDRNDVAARRLNERLDDRHEQTDVLEDAKEDNGEDEHHHNVHHGFET